MDAFDSAEVSCRICHDTIKDINAAVTPCRCKGSMKFVHVMCMEEYLRTTNKTACEICKFEYKINKVYKENTPETMPMKHIIYQATMEMLRGFKIIAGLIYTFGKRIPSVYTNGVVFSSAFGDYGMIKMGILGTLLCMGHNSFISSIVSAMKRTTRRRMNPRRTIDALQMEIHSRMESTSVATTYSDLENEDSIEASSSMDDISSDDTLSYGSLVVTFSFPTLATFRRDILCFFKTTWISIILWGFRSMGYSQLVALPVLQSILGKSRELSDFVLRTCIEPSFIEESSILDVLDLLMGLSLLGACALIVLSAARHWQKQPFLNVAYSIAKVYFFSTILTLHFLVILGYALHWAVFRFVNGEECVFILKNIYCNLLLHAMIGCFISVFKKKIWLSIAEHLRPGLYSSRETGDSFALLFKYVQHTHGIRIFKRMAVNTLWMICNILIFMLFNASIIPKLRVESTLHAFLFIKIGLMAIYNFNSINKLLGAMTNVCILTLSRSLGLDNYLYNRVVDDFDKNRLCWDINTANHDENDKRKVVKINAVLKKYRNSVSRSESSAESIEQCDITTEHQMNSKETMLNEKEAMINSKETMINGKDASKTEAIKIKRIQRSKDEQERMLFQKYEITDTKIRRYFGMPHNRKISIFYRPKFFALSRIIIYLSCLIFLHVFGFFIFELSGNVVSALPSCIHEKYFGALVLFTAISILKAAAFFLPQNEFHSKRYHFLKSSIIYVYCNILWPLIFTVGYVAFNCRNGSIISFSNVLGAAVACSSVVRFVITNIFLAMPIERYSVRHLFNQLAFIISLKAFLFLCYTFLNDYFGVLRFIKLATIVAVSSGVFFLFMKLIFTDWSKIVKEGLYFERYDVENYNHEDSVAAQE